MRPFNLSCPAFSRIEEKIVSRNLTSRNFVRTNRPHTAEPSPNTAFLGVINSGEQFWIYPHPAVLEGEKVDITLTVRRDW